MEDKEQYNNIPVFYCKHCLSLKILSVPGIEDLDFCDECGTTNIGKTDIKTWEKMYKEKYGFNYLDKF